MLSTSSLSSSCSKHGVSRRTFGTDAFMTKLLAEGWAFVYSTDLGGFASDYSNGVVMDALCNADATCVTNSHEFSIPCKRL
jgi:hypothetical protein